MATFILHFSGGHYWFTFHAASGDKIAISPPFITRSSAQHAINETRASCASAHLYRKYEDGGQYYFELWSERETLLLTSEKTWSEESRDYTIVLVKRDCATAGLKEMVF